MQMESFKVNKTFLELHRKMALQQSPKQVESMGALKRDFLKTGLKWIVQPNQSFWKFPRSQFDFKNLFASFLKPNSSL